MKRTYQFAVTKNQERQGAWLMTWFRDLPEVLPEGQALSEIQASSGASAWTTLNAAKRAAAAVVGRQRLPWEEVSEKAEYKASIVHKD